MNFKLFFKKIFFFAAFCFLLEACSEPTSDNTLDKNQERNYKMTCNDSIEIDSAKLELGHVQNLVIYNGVKFLKLGKPKNKLIDCVLCDSSEEANGCKLKDSIYFLDNNWIANVYFINDTLSRIKLNLPNANLTEIYEKLSLIFGKPNVEDLKIVQCKNYSGEPTITSYDLRDFTPYFETTQDYIIYFKNDSKSEELIRQRNKKYLRGGTISGKYEYLGPPKKVKIQFYSELELQNIWESKIILQLNISCKSYLEVGGEKRQYDIPASNNEKLFGYSIIKDYEVTLNIYNDKKTRTYFQTLPDKILKKQHIKEIILENEENKKLLKEF